MRVPKNRGGLLAIAAICTALGTTAMQAQTVDTNLHIHGFGDWICGKTDGNDYQSASEHGSYDDAAFGLNIRYDASEKIAVVSQLAWEHGGHDEHSEDVETLLDYAFVQYAHNDRLNVRIGRTYHPFGIYSEIRDIGTARPFIEQPPEIYGELGIVSSSLEGVNLYGTLPAGSNWGLHYDLYGGATELPVIEAGEDEEEISEVHDMVGARLILDTPVSGLRASISAFNGKLKEGDNPGESHHSVGAAIDYVTERLWLRAETAHHEEDDESARGTYIEAAYRLKGPVQLTARWGTIHTEFPEKEEEIEGRFFRQRDVAAGVNFWIDPKVVIKTELHFLNGNRFALADPIEDADEKTRVFQAGVQFTF